MAIYRTEKINNFTQVTNQIFRNKNISMRAKGLLCFMLSLPDDWQYSEAGLVACVKEGKSAIRSALKELEEEGYLVRRRVRDDKGRMIKVEYDIYEVPVTENVENACFEPKADFPKVENPIMEKQPQKNKNRINNIKNKTNNINLSVDELEVKIRGQIEYDWLNDRVDIDKGILKNIFSSIVALEVICLSQEEVKIGDTVYPSAFIQKKIDALTSQHIEYILDCMGHHTEKIRNIKAYLQAAIINSIDTIDVYYDAEVRHDMRYGAVKGVYN